MTHRFFVGVMAASMYVACLIPQPVAGQVWTPPRTPDGQPDLEGVWAITVLTPLERPRELAGKEFLTEEEAAQFVRQTLDAGDRDKRATTAEADLNRNYNEFWRERGNVVVPNRRTSLIVDPRDGRIPPFTPEAKKKRDARTAAQRLPSGPEDLALRLRCITRGLPMVPTPNNNFFGKDDFHGADENLRVTERLTRTAADSIRYEFTVDDATAFTRPWSGEIPFVKSTQQIFDYECHEGNYAMFDILAGARAEEKQAAAVTSK